MKRRRTNLCLFLALLLLLTAPCTVYGASSKGEQNEDKTLAPYFYVEGADPSVDNFPLKDTNVTANINGSIAETYVTQTYANEGSHPINARYVFPVSTKVSVHGMKMEIGDQIITAKIKEKEEAKEEFEEAKSEGKSASLLEQQRPNAFTMDVANIMPGDTVKIELHYTELITATDGISQFVFPTVVGPRYTSLSEQENEEANGWTAIPYLEEGNTPPGTYDITVNLTSGVPISELSCKSHEIQVSQETPTAATVTLANPTEYAGDRDFILDYKLTGDSLASGLMLDNSGTENFFMLMIQPPERFQPEEIPPREYIFVLDVSGSMGGYPLDTAKNLIRNLVTNLKESDRFNLILFSDETVPLADKSLNATVENINKAVYLIDQLEGGGGTELAPAIQQALSFPKEDGTARSIVTITDGFLSGEKEIFDMIQKNLGDTSFFSFGIGTSVNRYLIEGIAKSGAGEAFIVTDSEDADQTAERFRTYIQSPLLTNIQISYDGFEVYDVEPSGIPTLFAQKPVVLFGKWRGEPSGTITITGKTGNQDYQAEIPVSSVTPSENNQAIRYLWARTKVEQLTDYGSSNETEEAVKKEVTQLGLDYSMMTPYTSFIAVAETIRNTTGSSTDVNQPLPLPANVSNLAVGMNYTVGSEPGEILLLVGLMAVLLVHVMKRKKTARG